MTRSWKTLENVRIGGEKIGPGRTIADLDEDLAAELEEAGAIALDDGEAEDVLPEAGDDPIDDLLSRLTLLDRDQLAALVRKLVVNETLIAAFQEISDTIADCAEAFEETAAALVRADPGDDTIQGPEGPAPAGGSDGGDLPRADRIRAAVAEIVAKGDPADLTSAKTPTPKVAAIERVSGLDDVKSKERTTAMAELEGGAQ